MTTSPARDVASHLATLGIASLGSNPNGWSLFVGTMPDEPSRVIVVRDAGGEDPVPNLRLDFPRVTVLVRGDPNDYENAYTKALEARDALLGQSITGAGGLKGAWQNGDIVHFHTDERRRHYFSATFTLVREGVATGYSAR